MDCDGGRSSAMRSLCCRGKQFSLRLPFALAFSQSQSIVASLFWYSGHVLCLLYFALSYSSPISWRYFASLIYKLSIAIYFQMAEVGGSYKDSLTQVWLTVSFWAFSFCEINYFTINKVVKSYIFRPRRMSFIRSLWKLSLMEKEFLPLTNLLVRVVLLFFVG